MVLLLASGTVSQPTGATALGQRQRYGSLSDGEPRSSPTCVNVVENGGFEQGPSDSDPWTLGGFTNVSEWRIHEGSFGVWLGGYGNADDTLQQLVAIPAGAEALNLRYWWNMQSLDDTETPYDFLYVTLQTAGGEVLRALEAMDNTDLRGSWIQSSFDLSEFSDTSLRIHFRCVGNAAFVTSYFLDDIELEVCGDLRTPTPTATPTPSPTPTPTVVIDEWRYLPLIWLGALK
jgi:hypothetical protein